ncbi:peptide chain release factor N(5)-glutamine methyltransferase [Acerihabitans arboris]|uniref:Release factor glutamine methyltransferase n=1 Tax=Acerihabitans arboris TaxID=2691583 RepID=A0A845SE07_9GAMM|nr:peptide chain release factor N(5)-glutamine methyltransferase [Acerihabitans arboris]NDL63030.1 peptide chain release factor N(5)-glutamine methyltransferase [Acerihabitans arboris]
MRCVQWLDNACRRLAGGDSPKRDAEILLGFVIGRTRTWLLAFGETPLTPQELSRLDALLERRAAGEPIAYLTGEREFWSLTLRVSPATLIPRPDTECLVEQALALLPDLPAEILDLGTGTGAVALALASERPSWRVTGVDVLPDAVALARENALRLGIANARFETGSWFKSLQGMRYTLIVSNPPYIDVNDPHLGRGDVRFEPSSALMAGDGGLADLAAITAGAGGHLQPGGWLALEHGWRQGEAVRGLLSRAGFGQVGSRKDYGGNERVSMGQWPG